MLLLAKVIKGSGASVVAMQELGKVQAAALSATLGRGWKYQRAQGASGNGLNAVFWRDEWTLQGKPYDWNLPSFGQMQRTLIVCRLKHDDGNTLAAGSTHYAAQASDLSRTAANAAKLAQVKKVDELVKPIGDVLVIGCDLARTDDDDDVAWLKARLAATRPLRRDPRGFLHPPRHRRPQHRSHQDRRRRRPRCAPAHLTTPEES